MVLMPPIQKIAKVHKTNCLDTTNSKKIKNSQNKLYQHFMQNLYAKLSQF